jgi:hypothetical protein
MKDCPADTGQEPSACQDDRSSVSIHILEPLSLIPTNAAPEYGRPNTFKARVTNHSKAWALVGVNFYLWPCGTDGAAIGDQNSTFMGGAPYRLVAPGQSAWFASLNQHVYAGIEPAAWCVGVIAEHRADRSPRPPNILGDNNVASVSLAEMDSRAGSPVCQRYLQRLPGQWLCLIGPVFATPRFPPDPHLPWVPQGVPSWWSR